MAAITETPTLATACSPDTACAREAPSPAPSSTAAGSGRSETTLVVEYWTVTMDDQTSCGSCDATLAVVAEAVERVGPLAAQVGIGVEVRPRSVATWAEALDHQIVASPTIRAAGFELRPVHTDETEARVWTWRGTTSASVTPEALVNLLIRAVAARSSQLEDYLAAGGPASYVRQFLQEFPTPTSESADCGCA